LGAPCIEYTSVFTMAQHHHQLSGSHKDSLAGEK
jgi:hypothetical protein